MESAEAQLVFTRNDENDSKQRFKLHNNLYGVSHGNRRLPNIENQGSLFINDVLLSGRVSPRRYIQNFKFI